MKIDYFNIYDSLNAACIEAGTTITQICREVNVSRSTPEVWKNKNPQTLEIVGKMLEAIEKAKEIKDKSEPKIMPGQKNLTR